MASKFHPYVGPRPFELKDKDIFFGRERESRDLLSLVIAHNVVLVYAQSGAGKSSLINARLVPMMIENGFEVLPVTRVKGTPTGKIKNEDISNIFVFNTLMCWAEDEKSINIKNISQMTLVNFLNERKHPVDDTGHKLPRAIIFDQFEEIFSLFQDRWKDRAGFFEQVRDALKDSFLRVVFVMREDYIAQLDPYVNFLPEKLRTRFRLERLNKEASLLAIKEPLINTGRCFEEGVAEKLVDDLLKIRVETNPGETIEVTGEFIEAVQLQVVCQNLWLGLPEKIMKINMHHLEIFGNVEKALFQFYDDALREAAKISRVDEERLRAWFEEILITSMGTRGTDYRAPESTGGIPNAAIDVLDSKHLIRAEIRAGARWYELTHDKFIKPIKRSNERWRQLRAEKRWEKARIVGVSLIALIVILAAISIQNLNESGSTSFDGMNTFSNGTKVLILDNDTHMISVGDNISLKEGYVLNVTDIDLNGRTMYLFLLKDGIVVDRSILMAGETYSYTNNTRGTENLIKMKFDSVNRKSIIKEILQTQTLNLNGSGDSTNSIGIEFILIPSGEFDMGSSSDEVGRYDNEGPVHHVKFAKAFYLGKYEVTQKQWRDVMGTNLSYFTSDDLPVEQVSWDDVQQFIMKLNEKEGTIKYRLPSEAEWEYAARAGTISKYSFGDNESKLEDYAWFFNNSNKTTHPVGKKKPNSWGLYDMHGNVWELVQDRWHDNYEGAPIDGSSWESGNVTDRVGRGGGFSGYARNCRSANRYKNPADNINRNVGFRLLKDL